MKKLIKILKEMIKNALDEYYQFQRETDFMKGGDKK